MKAIMILPGIICTLLASNAIAGSGNESGGLQVITSIATILGAILVFIVSQMVLKLVIEPVQQLKGSIGQTANTLLRYQAKITNAADDDEISATVKESLIYSIFCPGDALEALICQGATAGV